MASLIALLLLHCEKFVSYIVYIDVGDVRDRFHVDPCRGDQLYAANPNIWIKAFFRCFLVQGVNPAGAYVT